MVQTEYCNLRSARVDEAEEGTRTVSKLLDAESAELLARAFTQAAVGKILLALLDLEYLYFS